VLERDESSFFSAAFFCPALFDTGTGLRPHIRIEMSLHAAALPPIARPIASPVTLTEKSAADTLSALASRVLARRRGRDGDDPTIVRHVDDLAALKPNVSGCDAFRTLVRRAMAGDQGRGGEAIAFTDPAALFVGMLDRLATDPLWATEYKDYVDAVSFAQRDELLGFEAALAAVRDLVALVEGTGATKTRRLPRCWGQSE
jgi:hypothetical protein